jgi:spore coat protein CotH
MNSTPRFLSRAVLVAVLGCAAPLFAQPSPDGPPGGGFPGGGFPGGPGGPMGGGETKLVAKFDTNGDKRLDATERKAAREHLAKEAANGGGRRRGPGGPAGFGGPVGRGGEQTPPQPGEKLTLADVASYADKPLYDTSVIRTLFLTFESADWEKELADFNNTDVEVPATLVVDGKTYKDVGVHFRGMSSFMMVGEGRKRSLNLSLDFVHEDQRLGDVKTLNLNNAHEDPSFLRQVLFAEIAKGYLAAPRANFVRVVINGESWGLYVNSEQFNKDFTKTHYGSGKGARWKVTGSPNGRGGLAYLGDDSAPYKAIYDLKTKDDETSWAALIRLTKILSETPPDKLEAALAPILDIDGALKFLALDNALINNDGYWVRASDYSLYLDEKGRFHLVPHDTNETFARPGGPGFGGGPGGPGGGGRGGNRMMGGPGGPGGPGMMMGGSPVDGVKLDPLVAANDANKPLLSKLLAAPALKRRYLGYMHDIATHWLDWQKLGPIAERYQALIDAEVKKDTRKLESYEEFQKSVSGQLDGRRISLKDFADQRRAYLLNHAEIQQAVDKK